MSSLYIIDNFYANPNRIRQIALEASYIDVHNLNYPGLQSSSSFFSNSLVNAFKKILNQPLEINPSKLTFGKFRFMFENASSRIKVHTDGEAHWTGLVYLNLPEQCAGGTNFYRHKDSGIFSSDCSKKCDEVVLNDSLNLKKWDIFDFVSMEYNRLILFRGDKLFHSHTHGFGSAQQDGRLTQNFFFNKAAS